MKYTKVVRPTGIVDFLIDEDMTEVDFRLLIDSLASALNAPIEWATMPEAEIGRITLSKGMLYAKFDCMYGVELRCMALMAPQVARAEAVLSATVAVSKNGV